MTLRELAGGHAFRLYYDNELKALIGWACAQLHICWKTRLSSKQAIEFAELVRIPKKYGKYVYRLLLERVLGYLERNIDEEMNNAFVFEDDRVGWKSHVEQWTIDTSWEKMQRKPSEDSEVSVWIPRPAKLLGIKKIVDGAIGEVAATKIWDGNKSRIGSKSSVIQAALLQLPR